jgi:nucleoside-diphosphate-sugar epimerase
MADYTPKSILLTGGCGFIGSHVCKFLVSKAGSCGFGGGAA